MVGSGNRQVPLVIVGPPVTQRAGGTQDGPAAVSHGLPSLASAAHVPGVCPETPKHVDALVHTTLTPPTLPH